MMPHERLLKTLLPAVFLTVGAVLLIVAIAVNRASARKKAECTVRTTGLVSRLEPRKMARSAISDGVPMTTWVPSYEFYAGGQTITVRGSVGQEKGRMKVGQTVTIYYNAKNPSRIYVPDERTGTLSLLLGGIGALFLVIGIAALLLLRQLV